MSDLWRFDLETDTWTQLARSLPSGPVAVYRDGLGSANSAAWTALDPEAGRWFFSSMPASDQPRRLYALDLERGAAEAVVRLWEDPVELLGMAWDAPHRRVVLLAYPLGGDEPAKPVQVWQVPVLEPQREAAARERPGSRWPVFLLLGALVVAAGASPGVRMRGEDVPLSDVERRLLRLLAEARASGVPFVPADALDEALFAGYDNLDYVRKMRNEVLRGLSDALEPYRLGRGEVIVRRRSAEDRRRIEYALGEDVRVVVEEPRGTVLEEVEGRLDGR